MYFKNVVPKMAVSGKHQFWRQWRTLENELLGSSVVKNNKEVAENQSHTGIRK